MTSAYEDVSKEAFDASEISVEEWSEFLGCFPNVTRSTGTTHISCSTLPRNTCTFIPRCWEVW